MSKKNGESKKTFKVAKNFHKKSRTNKITPYGSSSGTIAKRSLKSRCAKIKAHAIAAKANMKRIKARNPRRVATSKPHKSRGRRHRRRKTQNKKTTCGEQAPRSTAVPGATAQSYVHGSNYSMSVSPISHCHDQVITRDYFMDDSETTRSGQAFASTSVADPTTATNNASARTYIHGSDYSMTVSNISHVGIIARNVFVDNRKQNYYEDHSRTYHFHNEEYYVDEHQHQDDYHQEYYDAPTFDFHQENNFGVQNDDSEPFWEDDDGTEEGF